MTQQEYQPGKKNVLAAVLTVAATYGYYLIFAQFGFLKTVLAVAGGEADAIKPILATMGLAGIAGSVLAAKFYQVRHSRILLQVGFAVCALAAGLSVIARGTAGLHGVALLTGLGTGFTTVTLAGCLRRATGGGRLGTIIGIGTGLAYGLCNLPAVFAASASGQAGFGVLAATAGVAGAMCLNFVAPPHIPEGIDYSLAGRGTWTLVFLVLVGLDSAGFYVIQHTPALKEETWSGAGRLEANAGMHLIAALLAGFALDRRWMGRTVGVGALALLAACWMIDEGAHKLAESALLYTAGVSIYSTALVFYPTRSLRPGLAAFFYGIAGWGGSALGIGLAEGRHLLPHGIIMAAGAIILGLLLVRRFFLGREARGVG
jgi:cytochrome c oxidase cbb3-type subunit 2